MTMTDTREQTAAPTGAQAWNTADSRQHYRLDDWSDGHFSINDAGHLAATRHAHDLYEIIEGLAERDIRTPVLLRFSDILRRRLEGIRTAFDRAIEENKYEGGYSAVYPIKVNQQHQVVEEMVRHGSGLGFGLEVGSKPELLAVMSMSAPEPDRLIVCNGFKDEKYIEAVVLSTKLGRNIIPVVESLGELKLIIKQAERYGVRPAIGVRVKLASGGSGRWKESVGSRSKFGLFVSEVLEAVEELRKHDMLDCLQLVHCHSGSQIQNIRSIKDVVTELTQVYVELARLGAGVKYLDVGGGLGVDYTGLQSNQSGSINYSLEEFASDVVYRIKAGCDAAEVEHPTIITECGRAMVAYSSVLVFNVVGSTGPAQLPEPPADVASMFAGAGAKGAEIPQPLLDLEDAYKSVERKRLLECYHDALQARDAAMTLFSLGYLGLEQRGMTERLFWATLRRIHEVCKKVEPDELPDELLSLSGVLSDVYFSNFSMFQSMPDAWAIDQLFPIMPIHRLDEQPNRRAVLADITCDSDGTVDQFIGDDGQARALDVHPLNGKPYYLGVFLVGAYQEILGDLHNLFGDAHAVHITTDDDGGWAIEEVVHGDTAGEVLRYVQYDTDKLFAQLSRDCERAVRKGVMAVTEMKTLLKFYDRGLRSYTYLEDSE